MSRKIITKYNPKPGPNFSFDWEAMYDEFDLGDQIGYGATEAEAREDFLRLLQEQDECEHPEKYEVEYEQ